jgi:hypothetical protein
MAESIRIDTISAQMLHHTAHHAFTGAYITGKPDDILACPFFQT